MKAQNQQGFTIIEISLFLGVSMILLAGMLTGITAAINRQRFTDSVQSSQAFLQQQFSETINVVNNRPGSAVGAGCNATGTPQRGASSCIVVGKALHFSNGADEITSYPVISDDPANKTVCAENYEDEWEQISQCLNPRIINNINTANYAIPWAAQTTSINKVDDINISHSTELNSGEITGGEKEDLINYIILLRSPYSGRTFIYGYNGAQNDLKDETKSDNQSDFLVCIHSQDISNAYAGVYFTNAGSQDSVVARFKYKNDNCEN